MDADRSQAVIDQLNYEKKMQDLDYQIKIAQVKKINESAKQQDKQESSGMMQYMNTPHGNLPYVDVQKKM